MNSLTFMSGLLAAPLAVALLVTVLYVLVDNTQLPFWDSPFGLP